MTKEALDVLFWLPAHAGRLQAVIEKAEKVWAFLIKYFGTDQDPRLEEPLHILTTKGRFTLVTIHGQDYCLVDIKMRMLKPREQFNAQGFPPDYIIDRMLDGTPLTIEAQGRMCGNSVSPVLAEAPTKCLLSESVLFETPANDNERESSAA
jgi:DNA (cytosine-5)-methyltransferase 1